MARKTLIAGNWKMNKTVAEAQDLVQGLKSRASEMTGVDVAVCPPITTLAYAVEQFAGTPVKVGAQNVHWAESGAFTGEVSADMLAEIPVDYVIIGYRLSRSRVVRDPSPDLL